MSDHKPDQSKPQYLGDGVYVSFDGYSFRLSSIAWFSKERSTAVEHEIYLDPIVYAALVAYVERTRKESTHE